MPYLNSSRNLKLRRPNDIENCSRNDKVSSFHSCSTSGWGIDNQFCTFYISIVYRTHFSVRNRLSIPNVCTSIGVTFQNESVRMCIIFDCIKRQIMHIRTLSFWKVTFSGPKLIPLQRWQSQLSNDVRQPIFQCPLKFCHIFNCVFQECAINHVS